MNIEYKTGTLLIFDSNMAGFIIKEFTENYSWAKEKYTGRKFLISGIVYFLRPDPNNRKDIFFEEDEICVSILIPYLKRKRFYRRLLCYMKYYKGSRSRLIEGNHITLKGELVFDSAANDVAFRECELVE
ncbi:hypothetical protein P0136_12515 [Lentisphaerota bacterium ZTH]|nr:hypothetical protein JYG24_09970 [Lentisphaerota bacterium]WET06181.1 hypothetical protein P0136_12515 [Lentisphaerota bacterium ZTH]